jgi:hypothetical protein
MSDHHQHSPLFNKSDNALRDTLLPMLLSRALSVAQTPS